MLTYAAEQKLKYTPLDKAVVTAYERQWESFVRGSQEGEVRRNGYSYSVEVVGCYDSYGCVPAQNVSQPVVHQSVARQ